MFKVARGRSLGCREAEAAGYPREDAPVQLVEFDPGPAVKLVAVEADVLLVVEVAAVEQEKQLVAFRAWAPSRRR